MIFAPGKLTCFFPAIAPLSRTSQVILFPRPILRIFNSIAPLSKDIFPPFLMPLTYLRLSICNDFFPLRFLFAVRTGRFRGGRFDRDLLPVGHPLRSSKDKKDLI